MMDSRATIQLQAMCRGGTPRPSRQSAREGCSPARLPPRIVGFFSPCAALAAASTLPGPLPFVAHGSAQKWGIGCFLGYGGRPASHVSLQLGGTRMLFRTDAMLRLVKCHRNQTKQLCFICSVDATTMRLIDRLLEGGGRVFDHAAALYRCSLGLQR